MFESFSDLALCTLTVSLVLVSLLATNVTQRINVQMNENQFNKDALPARTYIGAPLQRKIGSWFICWMQRRSMSGRPIRQRARMCVL